jgi:hypothetical protein
MVLDNYKVLEKKWNTSIDIDAFREIAYRDPNHSMVDQRSETVSEARNRMWELIGSYTPRPHISEYNFETPEKPDVYGTISAPQIEVKVVETPNQSAANEQK